MGAADSPSTTVAPPLDAATIGNEDTLKKPATQNSFGSSANDSEQLTSSNPALIRAMELSASKAQQSISSSTDAEETKKMLERVERTIIADGDSDLEVETEVPSLESMISWEILKHLKPKEKKRQEVINGNF